VDPRRAATLLQVNVYALVSTLHESFLPVTNGTLEAMDGKANVALAKAFGLRSMPVLKVN
jgi:hypothetical protein